MGKIYEIHCHEVPELPDSYMKWLLIQISFQLFSQHIKSPLYLRNGLPINKSSSLHHHSKVFGSGKFCKINSIEPQIVTQRILVHISNFPTFLEMSREKAVVLITRCHLVVGVLLLRSSHSPKRYVCWFRLCNITQQGHNYNSCGLSSIFTPLAVYYI